MFRLTPKRVREGTNADVEEREKGASEGAEPRHLLAEVYDGNDRPSGWHSAKLNFSIKCTTVSLSLSVPPPQLRLKLYGSRTLTNKHCGEAFLHLLTNTRVVFIFVAAFPPTPPSFVLFSFSLHYFPQGR